MSGVYLSEIRWFFVACRNIDVGRLRCRNATFDGGRLVRVCCRGAGRGVDGTGRSVDGTGRGVGGLLGRRWDGRGAGASQALPAALCKGRPSGGAGAGLELGRFGYGDVRCSRRWGGWVFSLRIGVQACQQAVLLLVCLVQESRRIPRRHRRTRWRHPHPGRGGQRRRSRAGRRPHRRCRLAHGPRTVDKTVVRGYRDDDALGSAHRGVRVPGVDRRLHCLPEDPGRTHRHGHRSHRRHRGARRRQRPPGRPPPQYPCPGRRRTAHRWAVNHRFAGHRTTSRPAFSRLSTTHSAARPIVAHRVAEHPVVGRCGAGWRGVGGRRLSVGARRRGASGGAFAAQRPAGHDIPPLSTVRRSRLVRGR
jgi:hypothetical protein